MMVSRVAIDDEPPVAGPWSTQSSSTIRCLVEADNLPKADNTRLLAVDCRFLTMVRSASWVKWLS